MSEDIKELANRLNIELYKVSVTWPDRKESFIVVTSDSKEYLIKKHREEFPGCRYVLIPNPIWVTQD